MDPIDVHLSRLPDAQRDALLAVCATIRRALPGAEGVFAYGLPTFKVGTVDGAGGVAVVGLDGFARHNSLFPYSGRVLTEFAAELDGYVQTKGSIHFAADRAFPAALLRRILAARIREINAEYPKRSGEMREFYDNGRPKLTGRMSGSDMTGAWSWYRRDGSLMRTGSFRRGQQVGEWVTYDRDGRAVTTTRMG